MSRREKLTVKINIFRMKYRLKKMYKKCLKSNN